MCVSCECCVCCQVEVSATGRSPVQRSPTYCGVSCCVIYNLEHAAALARVEQLRQKNKNQVQYARRKKLNWTGCRTQEFQHKSFITGWVGEETLNDLEEMDVR